MKNQKEIKSFSGFKNPEITGIPLKLQKSSSFEIGKEKINSLKQAIEEINFLIKERESLRDEILGEGEKIKTEINNFLLENQGNVEFQENRESIREKNDLRYKKIEISELQLKEKIECWKDVALLKKELRIYEKEVTEKQERIESFNRILGES